MRGKGPGALPQITPRLSHVSQRIRPRDANAIEARIASDASLVFGEGRIQRNPLRPLDPAPGWGKKLRHAFRL